MDCMCGKGGRVCSCGEQTVIIFLMCFSVILNVGTLKVFKTSLSVTVQPFSFSPSRGARIVITFP